MFNQYNDRIKFHNPLKIKDTSVTLHNTSLNHIQ